MSRPNPLLHSPSAHCLQLTAVFWSHLAALAATVSCSRQLLSEKSPDDPTPCSGQQQTDTVTNTAEHFVDKLLVVTKLGDKREGTVGAGGQKHILPDSCWICKQAAACTKLTLLILKGDHFFVAERSSAPNE